MECRNHAGMPALDRCTACAEPFCHSCLVEIHGQRYCGSCKVVTLKSQTAPLDNAHRTMCPEAKEALTFALIGLIVSTVLCAPVALICGPLALTKAASAKTQLSRTPTLDGRGVATAAQIIGIGALVMSVMAMAIKVMSLDV